MEINPTQKNPAKKELLNGLLDELLRDYKQPEDVLGEQGLLKQLSKAVLERVLGAELAGHLGYEKHDPAGYKLMELTWGTPKQIEAAVKVESEKAAAKRLAAAKKLQGDKKTEEACTALEKLIEYYPNSKVTTEAKALLEKLKK